MTASKSSVITQTANRKRKQKNRVVQIRSKLKNPRHVHVILLTDRHKEDLSVSARENQPRRKGSDFFRGRRGEIPLLKCNYTKYVYNAGRSMWLVTSETVCDSLARIELEFI